MNNVFLYPGQGAQRKGMFLEICNEFSEAKKLIKYAEEISEEPISCYMWEIEETELSRSDRNQLALTAASLAVTKVLCDMGFQPEICAGFSLGEYAALCTAKIISFEDTIRLVKERGKIMQKQCEILNAESEQNKSGMAAVIGLDCQSVVKAIENLSKDGICFASNLNSVKQTVISGTADGLKKAETLCMEAGARRFIPLKVAGPFHSPLMMQAGIEFEKVLSKVNFKNPQKRIFSNVTGKEIFTGEEAKNLAVKHFTSPVRWIDEESEIGKIIDYKNVNCGSQWNIFETGQGNVLSGLWRDSTVSQNIGCVAVNSVEVIKNLEEEKC